MGKQIQIIIIKIVLKFRLSNYKVALRHVKNKIITFTIKLVLNKYKQITSIGGEMKQIKHIEVKKSVRIKYKTSKAISHNILQS